jgi:hypothetical protein
MQPTNKIRFVHGNHQDANVPKFTVAYHRDEGHVLFAFTNLFHKDEYVRADGRKVSEDRLLAAFAKDFLFEDTRTVVIDGIEAGFFSEKEKVGALTMGAFKGVLSSVIADHVLDGMNLMDLKHSFVSERLFSFVGNYNAVTSKNGR